MMDNFKDQFERPRTVDEIAEQCDAAGITLRRKPFDDGIASHVSIVSGNEDTGIATVIYRPGSGRFNGVTNLGESFDSAQMDGYMNSSWFEALAVFFWVPKNAMPDEAHNRRADDLRNLASDIIDGAYDTESISLEVGTTSDFDIVALREKGGSETE